MSTDHQTKRQPNPIVPDPWTQLRTLTDARIGLGRCGVAQPLGANLDFKLSHARARDAVHTEFQQNQLVEEMSAIHQAIALNSAAESRETFLTRPDLGRQLSDESKQKWLEVLDGREFDIALIVGDGLSAKAIHENATPFVQGWLDLVIKAGYSVAPIAVVKNARVAVADPIGVCANARISIILIGERPGLSSPDSMGVYITYAPKIGSTDDKRNCISNIRKAGYPIREGVRKTCYLIEQAMENRFSGVKLKDNMEVAYLPFGLSAEILLK